MLFRSQASRAKTGDAGLRSLIEDALEAVEKEPGNLNLYRDLASNYRKLGDFDNSLLWVNKARETEAAFRFSFCELRPPCIHLGLGNPLLDGETRHHLFGVAGR